MTLRARVLGILAMVHSASISARMEFVNRDFKAAINIRRYVVL